MDHLLGRLRISLVSRILCSERVDAVGGPGLSESSQQTVKDAAHRLVVLERLRQRDCQTLSDGGRDCTVQKWHTESPGELGPHLASTRTKRR